MKLQSPQRGEEGGTQRLSRGSSCISTKDAFSFLQAEGLQKREPASEGVASLGGGGVPLHTDSKSSQGRSGGQGGFSSVGPPSGTAESWAWDDGSSTRARPGALQAAWPQVDERRTQGYGPQECRRTRGLKGHPGQGCRSPPTLTPESLPQQGHGGGTQWVISAGSLPAREREAR